MDNLIVQVINGISYGLLLFIITCGLSLIFGIMGVLNLAHGSLYMIAAYLAFSITHSLTASFWLALVVTPVVVALISILLEFTLLRPTYHLGHLAQVLLTLGVAYVFHDLATWIWGTNVLSITVPPLLAGSVEILGQSFPVYRLAIILFGVIMALVLWLLLDKTRWGAIIRAGLSDQEMITGLGVNIKLVFTVIFFIGAFMAGLGGVIAAPVLGIYPGMDFEILILALVVLVIGGLGSISGSLLAGLMVGVVETLGKVFFPQLAMFIIFVLMALVLLFRPQGLLGKKVH